MCFVLGFSIICGNTLSVSAADYLNINSSYSKVLFVPVNANGFSNIPGATVEYFDMTEGSCNVDYYFPISLHMQNTDNFVSDSGYYQLVGYFSLYYPLSTPNSFNQYLNFIGGYIDFDNGSRAFIVDGPSDSLSINYNYQYKTYVRGRDIYGILPNNESQFLWNGTVHLNFSYSNGGLHQIVTDIGAINAKLFYDFYCLSSSKSAYDSYNSTPISDGTSHDLQETNNSIAQDNADTNKDTNNKITNFFNSFFDNLVHIFVPEDGFFSQWFSSLNDFMAQKLGFLWSPFDFMLSFLNGVYSGSGSASLVFPELAWIDGTVIIPRTDFSFDNIGGQSFQDLRDMIYFATDVILLGAVISQFYKKIKLVFEGGGD